jgi:hypothetical protein
MYLDLQPEVPKESGGNCAAPCKVAPIKLQTQNIIKMKIMQYVPMSYHQYITKNP